DDLPGMIQVMLREPDELRERGIRWICDERLKKTFDGKIADCRPEARIERVEQRHIPAPVLLGGLWHCGPVLLRQERRGIAFEASKDELITAAQVKDELPAAVRVRNRMVRRIAGLDSIEGVAHGGTMPCFALHAAAQLILQ